MSEMNFEQARFNMIEQQIRPWDVLDQRVLDVLKSTPREAFVPQHYRALAFTDMSIPLQHGEYMMAPKLEGRMIQSLDLKPGDSVLEVGTGSGYVTACVSKLAARVLSVDIHADFIQSAGIKLRQQGITNAELRELDACQGWDVDASFDAIAITGSLPMLHHGFHKALNVGGRLFVIAGQPPVMEALLITRTGEDQWAMDSLFETSIPPLAHATAPRKFVF